MPHDAPPPTAAAPGALHTLEVRQAPARAVGPTVARAVGDAALALTWRVVQASSKESFLAATPQALRKVYYTADDGWQAPLHLIPPRPGTSGEPVLLAHGLGGNARDFDLGPSSLARALSSAGYAVYLFEHRADRSALPPEGAAAFNADDIATRDLDAALAQIRQHSGFARVLCVGHAFGAQLLLLRLAALGADDIAGTVLIAGAARFSEPASSLRTWGQIAQLLPSSWVLPTRRIQQLASPFIVSGADLGSPGTEGALARARLRHASGDLHVGVLKQVAGWLRHGHLTDATGRLDVVAALPKTSSLVIEPDNDPSCPPGAAEPAAIAMGAFFEALSGGWGHLDPLMGNRAPAELYPRILDFFETRRRACW